MEKKNTGLIVLVIVLCLSVGGLGGYIIGNKTFDDGKDMNNDRSDVIENNKNNNYDNNATIVNYSYGDEVTISKMSKVKDFIVGEGTIDLSKCTKLNKFNVAYSNIKLDISSIPSTVT